MKLKSGVAGSVFASTVAGVSVVEKSKSKLGASVVAGAFAGVSDATISVLFGSKSKENSSGWAASVALVLGSGVIAGVSVFSVAGAVSTEKLKSKAAGSAFTSGSAAFSTGAAAGLKFNDEVSNSKAASGAAVLFEVSSCCNWSKEELSEEISSFDCMRASKSAVDFCSTGADSKSAGVVG